MRKGENKFNWRVEKVREGRREGAVREERHWREKRRRIRSLLTIDIEQHKCREIIYHWQESCLQAQSSNNSFAMHERTRYLLRDAHF